VKNNEPQMDADGREFEEAPTLMPEIIPIPYLRSSVFICGSFILCL
jgi:hypothetical protein